MSGHDQGRGTPDDAKNFKVPTETPNSVYRVGQVVNNWGKKDPYNEDYQQALEAGWITEDCELTEAGITKLTKEDSPKTTANEMIDSSDTILSLVTKKPQEPRPTFLTTGTARQRGHEDTMGDAGKKRLMDSIQLALEERGFNVLDVYVEEKNNDGGEQIYTLSIEFGPTGGKDGDKKQKKILQLVGNENTLVNSLRRDSFNFPITKDVKKIRRAFKR